MTIIVFLIDTSASMNQRVFLGGRPTLLDVAKSAVETFVKVRQRSIDSRQDRYMLLTFEEPQANIKAGWKENLATFMSELKNLQANGLTTLSNALRHTFDVLNVNRMQHGIDTYGQGRCPFYLEPSIIVCITDGGQLSSNSGVQEELKMQGSSPGFELTREPFRWDQRLFSLVLRMTGQPSGDREIGLVPSDNSAIDAMCEVTGGRSYAITTHRMLHQCIDSLVQKVQAGVVIHFEKYGPDPPTIDGIKGDEEVDMLEERNGGKTAWQNVRRMIYVPRTNQKGFAGGFWPVPESYWPDPSLPTLPSRTAHPNVKLMCQAAEPLVVENFPFDKYELEPSPLTQFIIGRKQPTVCWQVYMQNSSRTSPIGFPFGYLKASTNLTTVNLFVMPYNYPVLLPLIDELFRVHRLKPTSEWRAQFAMYLASMPPYYAGPLKRALLRMGAGNIIQSIPEENYLSYSVLSYLKKLKAQAKTDYDRTCNDVALRVKASETKRVVSSNFKNPFDIPRHQLLDQVARLRTLFLRPSHIAALQQEALHNMPVGQMGNYQEYLKRMPNPLRELESAPVRQHMFGNPFKITKGMIIDEADIDLLGGQGTKSKKESNNNNNNINNNINTNGNSQMPQPPVPIRGHKRKAGPLPKDFRFRSYKNRRTHRGMEEEESDFSDTESVSSYTESSAPSSPLIIPPITPPASPLHNPFDKENSGLARFESFERMFGNGNSDGNLIIDETNPDEVMPMLPPPEEMNDVEKNEKIPIPPNAMNGFKNDNDSYKGSFSSTTKTSLKTGSLPNLPVPVSNSYKPVIPPATTATPTPPPPVSIPVPVPIKKKVKSSPPTPPEPNANHVDDEKTFQKNLELRINLHKEIRRPLLKMDYILSQLSLVAGSYHTKQNFIKGLAREALRFKRKRLAKELEQQAEVFAPFIRPSAS